MGTVIPITLHNHEHYIPVSPCLLNTCFHPPLTVKWAVAVILMVFISLVLPAFLFIELEKNNNSMGFHIQSYFCLSAALRIPLIWKWASKTEQLYNEPERYSDLKQPDKHHELPLRPCRPRSGCNAYGPRSRTRWASHQHPNARRRQTKQGNRMEITCELCVLSISFFPPHTQVVRPGFQL